MTEQISVGVIGCGKAGRAHLHWYARDPRCRIAGVYNRTTERAQECAAEYNTVVFGRWEDLVSSPDVRLVSVAGPSSLRAQQVIAACSHGKDVVCEKPMASSLAECEAMIAAAHDHGAHLFCFFNMRFHPVVEAIDATLHRIGPVFHMHFEYTQFRTAVTWRHALDQGGGVMKEQGVHPIDLALRWAGPAAEVSAETLIVNDGRDVEDHCISLLRFRSSATAYIYASYSDRQEEAMFGHILGRDGKINFTLSPYRPELNQVSLVTDRAESIPLRSVEHVDPMYPGLLDCTQRTIEHFIDCLVDDRPSPLDGVAGRNALEIALAAYESQRTHGKIAIPMSCDKPISLDGAFVRFIGATDKGARMPGGVRRPG